MDVSGSRYTCFPGSWIDISHQSEISLASKSLSCFRRWVLSNGGSFIKTNVYNIYIYIYKHCTWSFVMIETTQLFDSQICGSRQEKCPIHEENSGQQKRQKRQKKWQLQNYLHGWMERKQKTFWSRCLTWCHMQPPFSGETAFRESSHYSALTREITDSDARWSNWWLQNEVVTKWGRLGLNAVNHSDLSRGHPKGSLVGESSQKTLNWGLGIIIICPDNSI